MRKLALLLCFILCLGMVTALPASAAISYEITEIQEGDRKLFANQNAVEGLANSGFESALSDSNWYKYGGTTYASRSTDAQNGSYSLKITNPESFAEDNKKGVINSVSLIPGVEYEISAWFKAEGKTQGYSEIHGILYGNDENGEALSYSRMRLRFSNTYTTWTKRIFRFTAPQNSNKIAIYCYNYGPGTVYFDDVSVLVPKEVVPTLNSIVPKEPIPGTNYVINQNFESFTPGYRHDASASKNPDGFGAHHTIISTDVPTAEGASNNSLMFQNGSNSSQSGFSIANYYNGVNMTLVPGATYQFSAWVNSPQEGTSSTLAFWVSFDTANHGSDIAKKTWTVTHYPWWQQIIMEFDAPLDITSATFQIRYGSKTNPTYLDDLQVYMVDAPKHAFVESDELFYYSEWEQGYVSASTNTYYGDELVGGKVEYTFFDTDGETVLESCEIPYVNGEATYTFNTSLMAQKTERYYIGVKVYSSQGVLVQEEFLHVYRYDRPTYLGADGVFRKNGKEYNIVLGNGVNTERLNKDPRTGGVTVVQIVADPSSMGTTLKERMDLAHSMGLLCLINFYGNTNGGAPEKIEGTINTVSWAKNHPALFGYKVQDEPYQKGEPDEDMERAYARIRKEDPNHPVYLDDSVPGGYKWLYRYADIIDIDYYGGRSSAAPTIFTEKLEIAAQATKGRKPFTLLQQAFQYNGYLPTVDELRHFTYQAFFAGASGFGYHTLGVDGSDGVETCYMDSEDWAELGERWAPWEQGFLFDAFVNDKFEPLRSYRDDNVMWKTFRDGEDIYAVMFNRLKDSSVNASIPLTDANGNTVIGNYVAYRAAGTKGAGNARISGNGSLNVTLGGIAGRNGSMQLVEHGGMAAEIWKISPDKNLLPNGEFENAFTNAVPSSAWTAKFGYGSGGSVSVGSVSQLTSDTVGDTLISPATLGSTKFMKLERYNANSASLTDNRPSRLSIPLSALGLVSGKSYRFEGYFNIPSAVSGVGMHFTSNISQSDGDSISHSTGFVQRNTKTSGWEKRTYDFIYDGGTYYLNLEIDNVGEAGAVYFDELKIYEIDSIPTQILSIDGRFDAGQSATPFSTGSSASVAGSSFAIVADPDDAGNYALLIPDKKLADNSNNTPYPVKVPLVNSALSNLSVDDFLKYSFRIKVKADTVPEEDLTIDARFNNSRFISSNQFLTFAYTIPKDKVNTWLDVEIVTHAPNGTDNICFVSRLAGYDYYIDDLSVTHLEESYISTIKPMHAFSGTQGNYWGRGTIGVKAGTYTAEDFAGNMMCFVSNATSNEALAAVALYKQENGRKILEDIDLVSLNVSGEQSKATGTNFGINLGNHCDSEGTYLVEYFLWDSGMQTLLPSLKYQFTK